MLQKHSFLPLASLFDPDDPAEGSLDPLGTYLLSENLASRIASPGVRERQRNLRFLTLCCIGWETIAVIEPDIKPGDSGATLEQAFEWMVLDALVAGEKEGGVDELRIPGILKARQCAENKLNLNADRYLRMPGVFGFFGVYRTLAEYLDLVKFPVSGEPLLSQEGVRLLEVWKQEQALAGFGRVSQGVGNREYKALVNCLNETWKAGQSRPDKQAWAFIQKYMQPLRVGGPKEAKTLEAIIRGTGQKEEDVNRREILRVLDEPWALKIMQSDDPEKEKKFHERFLTQVDGNLKVLLEAILAYESFIRPLHDLFDDLLLSLTPHSRLIPITDAASGIPDLSARLKALMETYKHAGMSLSKVGNLGSDFENHFGGLSWGKPPTTFLEGLLDYHERVQKKKPPMGKAPWTERQGDQVGVRPLYRRNEGAPGHAGYVYFYRTRPLLDLLMTARGDHGKA